ncbi:MAG: glycosyltransferase [Candidatus Omnitrophica bacterium]|nr:glycosyltransferase [Candidatus Omnitrophota bacterium]
MSVPNYLVSCVITTKDRSELVIRAVKSVLGQSYRNIEIILVDDSDERGACEGVLRLGGEVKYIKNEKSHGACYSRNLGLSEAKGDFIAFLDDDDLWMPKKIEVQLKEAMKYPLVGCSFILCSGRTKQRVQQLKIVNYEDMLYHNYLGSCSFVLAQASAIKRCRFDETREVGQDWDMWLSVMQINSIHRAYNVKEYLVSYNQGLHPRISNTAKHERALFSLYEKHVNEYTPFTTNMFGVYNFIKVEDSLLLWGLREIAKVRLKSKGLIFFIKILLKRLLGRIEIF